MKVQQRSAVLWSSLVLAAHAMAFSTVAGALDGEWDLVRPDNTGIPGAEIRGLWFGPDGNLWTAARWEFWENGGLGICDLETEQWEVISSIDTPLPSAYINGVQYAGDVMWIGTGKNNQTGVPGGLVRKEGDSWTIFDTSNSPLLHNGIDGLDMDSEGHLWINNSNVQEGNHAIFEYDGTSWRMFTVPEDIPWEAPWNQFESLRVDANDHVWVTNTAQRGIAEYDGTSWTIHGGDLAAFSGITEDLDGNLWVVEGLGGYMVWKFDGTNFIPFGGGTPPFSVTTTTAVRVDPGTGDVYIGNWLGETIKSTNGGATWSSFVEVPSFVSGFAFDPSSDEVWVGSHRAIYRFDAVGTQIAAWNSQNTGMPWYLVDYMSFDRAGHFWIGTGETGLSRFDGQKWRNWGAHNAGSEPWPFEGNERMGGAYLDRNGDYWFGGNGIARWDPETEEFTGFWNWENNPGMGSTTFPWFAEDMNGRLFACTDGGLLLHFDGSLWIVEPEHPNANGRIGGMHADSQGNVWVAGWFELHKWNGQAWSMVGDDWPILQDKVITHFALGPDDTFLLGTDQGLVSWDGAGEPTLYDPTNSPLPAYWIAGVDIRSDGLIAVSSCDFGPTPPFPHCVAVIEGDIGDPGSWTVWQQTNSPFITTQLESVAFDASGDLWVAMAMEGAAVLRLGNVVSVEPAQAPTLATRLLDQNHPNPFQAATAIGFRLTSPGHTTLELFDVRGRLVRRLLDESLDAGDHNVNVVGLDLVPGVYSYRLRAGDVMETRQMTIIR